MNPKYKHFSINKESVILEYEHEGKEVIAVIEPYAFCTYLCDLKILFDRNHFKPYISRDDEILRVYYTEWFWVSWSKFITDFQLAKLFTDELLQQITNRHFQTEILESVFHTNGNARFSYN